MDSFANENWPETCSTLGLDCGSCTRKAASSVASICGGLDPQGLKQIFFQLYSSPGCRPMAQAFELAYQEATAPIQIAAMATAAAA
ncbi:MAG TPA: hypothetical protein VGP62_12005 [Bryobacteraceae bacterium]|jgi:hypothetical protein|nr:hypothetical protein [Bryobacteraceae bacterium]